MACFLVPAAEAVVATAANRAVKAKEPAELRSGANALPSDAKVPISGCVPWGTPRSSRRPPLSWRLFCVTESALSAN